MPRGRAVGGRAVGGAGLELDGVVAVEEEEVDAVRHLHATPPPPPPPPARRRPGPLSVIVRRPARLAAADGDAKAHWPNKAFLQTHMPIFPYSGPASVRGPYKRKA